MSYQVIARKWRPQAFEEVTGQEQITRTLRNAVENDRLHHAYLFSGARGVGKTTTARLLAKALNCHKSDRPTAAPCKWTDPEACPSCREIAEGRSIDVLEIDAASNTGVDNVREAIINTVGVRPARDRFKVFIIDEVHMLSGAAFNALLKTLEEPPPRVVFIMATTEAHKIPDTILSRSQQFEFRTIATQKIAERLRHIAGEEKIEVTDDALREIARAGEGSMRDAQSAFDQVISFSDGEIKTEDVEAALGIAGAELRSRVMRSVAEASAKDALAVVDDLVMRGHDLRNFCRDLLSHLRDLLVVKVAGAEAGAVDASDAERKGLAREAGEFSESDLVRFFHSLTETETRLREGAHPRYQLEIGLVKLIEMRRLAPLGRVLERLHALEEAMRAGGAPALGPPPAGGGGPAGGAAPRGGGGGGTTRPPVARPPGRRADALTPHAGDGGVAFAGTDPGARPQSDVPPWESDAQATRETAAQPRDSSAAQSRESSRGPSAQSPREPSAQTPALKLVTPAGAGAEPGAAQSAATIQAQSATTQAQTPPIQQAEPPSIRQTPTVQAQTPGAAGGPGAAARVDELVEHLKAGLEARRKPFLAIALEGAARVSFDGEGLSVEFAPEARHLRDNLAKPENAKLLREVCCEVAGREVGVQIAVRSRDESADDEREAEGRLEQQRLREQAERDPRVQELLRTFRAQIVEVRRVE